MLEDDQSLRLTIDTCTDSLKMLMFGIELSREDSVRADYLYRYVVQYGWPEINKGGLFAGIIAIHDHSRHHFYFPRIKQSLIRGEGDMQTYELMKYWISDGSSWEDVKSILDN